MLITQVKIVFGDFSTDEFARYDYLLYLFFVLTLFLSSLLMMNVLIGIISESVGRVYEARERSINFTTCEVIFEIECLMFWRLNAAPQNSFLVFTEYIEDETEADVEKGRI